MVFCTQCGTANTAEANFCKNCRFPLQSGVPAASPAKTVEKVARDLGKEVGEAGRRLGQQFEAVGRDVQRAWDRELGLLGPLLSALFGFAVLVIFLLIVAAIAASPGSRPFFGGLRDFLLTYLVVLLGLILLVAYGAYFTRTRNRPYRWFAPIVVATSIVAAFWIMARVLDLLDGELPTPVFRPWVSVLEVLLPILLVVGLVVGYVVMTVRFMEAPAQAR